MPVRKVVARTGKHFRGRFPSRKNRCMVDWESLQERDAIRYLEYSPLVASYEAQPSEETYYKNGVPHRYYPDLRARLHDDTIIDFEVKPKIKLESRHNKDKYGRIASMYAKQGRRFRILTEEDYRREPLRGNLERLQRASKLAARADDAAAKLASLGNGPRWTLRAAAAIVGSVDWVLALVSADWLRIDVHQTITGDSAVWLPTLSTSEGGGDDSLFI
jgi:hypothetical protein